MAKAANKMMVKALAKEFAPEVRVNGISSGYIQEPIGGKELDILDRIVLRKKGSVENIYHSLIYLIENGYVTDPKAFAVEFI